MRTPTLLSLVLLALGVHSPVAPGLRAGGGAPADGPPRRGTVRVDTLWSQALGTRKQFVVYLPPSYGRDTTRRYPVAYYLHGLWGSEWDWVRAGRLPAVMDSLVARGTAEMIVVMPDGDDGWYTTWNTLPAYRECVRAERRERPESYCVPWPHYDDYVARDLVARVDSGYRTLADRAHRAVAGLSMGGLGAVSLALAYPDVWSAAASHSGVLSPLYVAPDSGFGARGYATDTGALRRAAPARWPLIRPAFGTDTAGWRARDPARLAVRTLHAHRGIVPALYIDVGRDDHLLAQNRELHRVLDSLGVAHAYAEWPGRHDWAYWGAHVGESLAWIAARIGAPVTPRARSTPRRTSSPRARAGAPAGRRAAGAAPRGATATGP